MKNKKLEEISIELKLLHKISGYYEFPLAMFFYPLDKFPKGTRRKSIAKITLKFRQDIKKITDEFLEVI